MTKDKMKVKKPNLIQDMDHIKSDPRFKHIGTNPMLRYIPKGKTKVKIDERFAALKTSKFFENASMDPRGRKEKFSSKENVKKFYSMSSSESSNEDEEEVENASDLKSNKIKKKKQKEVTFDDKIEDENINDVSKSKKLKKKKQKTVQDKKKLTETEDSDMEDEDYEISNLNESLESGDDSSDEEDQINNVNEKISKKEKDTIPDDIKEQLTQYDLSRGEVELTDSSDDDSTTTEEGEEDEEFDWGELDKDAIWEDENTKVEVTSRFAVCNMNWDRIKSTDLMLLFSSCAPSGGSIKSVKIYLSEYGKERLAEENEKGPQELISLASSSLDFDQEIKDLEKLEKGQLSKSDANSHINFEAVRKYQRNRLRYYYAVVECDSIETSSHIYKECDRLSFEGSGTLMDLRYIPSDMDFDEDPVDVCHKLPKNYTCKDFSTSALHDSMPTITWDETNADRRKDFTTVMMQVTKGEDPDYDRLKAYIASSDSESEDEAIKKERIKKLRSLLDEIDQEKNEKDMTKKMFQEDSDENEDTENEEQNDIEDEDDDLSEDEDIEEEEGEESLLSGEEDGSEQESEQENNKDQFPKNVNHKKADEFFSIVKTLNEKENSKNKTREEQFDLVELFDMPLEDKIKKKNKVKLTPFEEMLEKRKQKREEKKKTKLMKEESGDEGFSDDELPDDIADDPFFKEELEVRKKTSQNKKSKKKKNNINENEDTDKTDNNNLALLLMDEEEDDKKHFSMRQIVEDSKQKKKKKSRFAKKKSKKEIEDEKERKKQANKFDVELDSRFNGLMTSSDFHIDPTHSNFKRTDAMEQIINKVQNKRLRNDYDNTPSPKKKCEESASKDPEVNNLITKLKHKSKLKK